MNAESTMDASAVVTANGAIAKRNRAYASHNTSFIFAMFRLDGLRSN
jgi:hypothetical protein